MMNARKKIVPVAILVASIFQYGCGKPVDRTRVPTGDPEPAVTRPTIPAGGEPAPLHSWIAVREQYMPDPVDPKGCTPPFIMQIENSGAFTAGPCTAEDDVVEGKISAEEAIELAKRIEPIVNNASAGATTPECENADVKSVIDIGLYVPPNSALHVFEHRKNEKKLCLVGGRDRAKALGSHVHSLLMKYYPKRQARS